MQVQLTKPALQQFVDEKVKSGEFPSAAAVVEDALIRMMWDDRTPTDEDIAAINQSEQQIDRGEFVDFEVFAAEMRRKYCGQ